MGISRFGVMGVLALSFAGGAFAQGPPLHVAKKISLPGSGTYYDYLHFDSASRRLYVSFGGQVVVFDPDHEKIVGTLSGANKVHGIALAEGKAFVSDGGADL